MCLLYEPLHSRKRQIRLLRIIPNTDDKICCELQVADLEDNELEYTALSYCWTKDSPSCGITVNGSDFYVRPNLINYLRSRADEDDLGWIFVDAICINQTDITEKSSQVALMGDVYRGAAEVTVWVDDEQCRHPAIERRASQIQEFCDQGEQLLLNSEAELNAFIKLKDPDMVALTAMNFCNSTYWTRVWTMQELTLGHKVTLRTKLLKIHWMMLLCILNYFLYIKHGQPPLLDPRGKYVHQVEKNRGFAAVGLAFRATEHSDGSSELYVWMRAWILLAQKQIFNNLQDNQRIDFRIAICVYALQQCSDLHDKVYGLLGMARCEIPVDYSISIPELYAHTLTDMWMDITREATISGQFDVQDAIGETAALVGSLKDGLQFWPAASILVAVLRTFDVRIEQLAIEEFVLEYTPLIQLKKYSPSSSKIWTMIAKILASSVLRLLPFIEAWMSWVAKYENANNNQKKHQIWRQQVSGIYDEKLETKFAGRTRFEQISNKLVEIGRLPLIDACHLIESIHQFPTYVEWKKLTTKAFQQILRACIDLKEEKEADEFDEDIFHACKLLYLRDELVRAARSRKDWVLRNENSFLEKEKGVKVSFDAVIDRFILAGHQRLNSIRELSTLQYQTWTFKPAGGHFCATVAQKGLRLSSRTTPVQLLRRFSLQVRIARLTALILKFERVAADHGSDGLQDMESIFTKSHELSC